MTLAIPKKSTLFFLMVARKEKAEIDGALTYVAGQAQSVPVASRFL